MKKRITVFTGTRAEYGLMRGIIAGLSRNIHVDMTLLVSGTHLEQAYGYTLHEIEQDKFAPIYTAKITLHDNSPLGICKSMGEAIATYATALYELHSELLIVLGDRYESFCAASAALTLNIPIAHLYGGEMTLGAIDEMYRHAITKMSYLHFVSCERYQQRVIQMGEDPDRVWCVGSTGIENVHTLPVLCEQEVRNYLSLPPSEPYFLLTYHPVTLDSTYQENPLHELLGALEEFEGMHFVFTGANADSGGKIINDILADYAANNPRFHFFMSLGVSKYINAARYSHGVIGNSSSGICEIPSLRVPVLDIGDRQKGRERSDAVLHCEPRRRNIADAIRQLNSPKTLNRVQELSNPLEGQHPSERIVSILTEFSLPRAPVKVFYDLR